MVGAPRELTAHMDKRYGYRHVRSGISLHLNTVKILQYDYTKYGISLTPNYAWLLDNPLLKGLKSAQNCASLGVRIILRTSALSLNGPS